MRLASRRNHQRWWKKREGLSRKSNFVFFHSLLENDRYTLTFAFTASRVASLTGLCLLVCVVMSWAGATALSLGAEQKEERVAGQAVGGARAPAGLAALVAPLTLPGGVCCIISATKEGSEDNSKLCS